MATKKKAATAAGSEKDGSTPGEAETEATRQPLEEAYNKRNLDVGDELLTADCVFCTPTAVQGIDGWKIFAS